MMAPEMTQIALISTPWPLFYRPSIQLGALKAYLNRELPEVSVDSHHVYLAITHALGHGRYGQISKRTCWQKQLTPPFPFRNSPWKSPEDAGGYRI